LGAGPTDVVAGRRALRKTCRSPAAAACFPGARHGPAGAAGLAAGARWSPRRRAREDLDSRPTHRCSPRGRPRKDRTWSPRRSTVAWAASPGDIGLTATGASAYWSRNEGGKRCPTNGATDGIHLSLGPTDLEDGTQTGSTARLCSLRVSYVLEWTAGGISVVSEHGILARVAAL
jgi:hypothetical protein